MSILWIVFLQVSHFFFLNYYPTVRRKVFFFWKTFCALSSRSFFLRQFINNLQQRQNASVDFSLFKIQTVLMSHRKSVTSHPSKDPGRQIGWMTTTKTIQYPSTEFAVGGGKKKIKGQDQEWSFENIWENRKSFRRSYSSQTFWRVSCSNAPCWKSTLLTFCFLNGHLRITN